MLTFSKYLAALAFDIYAGKAIARSLEHARHALLDYLSVTIAGSREPLAAKTLSAIPNGDYRCALIDLGRRAHQADAALIHGALGHVLDLDDVNARAFGHPSVVIPPAILAEAERDDPSETEVLWAIVAATEAWATYRRSSVRIGIC